MKKLMFLFVLSLGLAEAQMPNISKVWLNNNQPYKGKLGEKVIMLTLNTAEQNKNNDQEYWVTGTFIINEKKEEVKGTLFIKKYKDLRKGGKIFGIYELVESPLAVKNDKYFGKFIFSFNWDKENRQITNKKIEFSGHFQENQLGEKQKTFWVNE